MKKISIILLAVSVLFCMGCGGEQEKNDNSEALSSTEEQPSENVSEENSSDAESTVEESVTYDYKKISQSEASEIMETQSGYIILDVRRQDEFANGHIPGAICVPNEDITDSMPPELPDKSQLILVYCRSGNRSKEAALKLAGMGYENILEFGGIIDWQGEIVTD